MNFQLERRPVNSQHLTSFKSLVVTAGLGGVAGVVALLSYRLNFGGSLSSLQSDWGDAGDFFGGLVGTWLAFLSFIALMATVRLQAQALAVAQKEIEITRVAMKDSQGLLEEQLATTSAQVRSDAVFQALRLHSETIACAHFTDGQLTVTGLGFLSFVVSDMSYFSEAQGLVATLAQQLECALLIAHRIAEESQRKELVEIVAAQIGEDERFLIAHWVELEESGDRQRLLDIINIEHGRWS